MTPRKGLLKESLDQCYACNGGFPGAPSDLRPNECGCYAVFITVMNVQLDDWT